MPIFEFSAAIEPTDYNGHFDSVGNANNDQIIQLEVNKLVWPTEYKEHFSISIEKIVLIVWPLL